MKKLVVLFLIFASTLTDLHAEKLFSVEISASGSNQFTAENSSLPDLIDDLIKRNGDFSGLKNETAWSGSLTYFAYPNALNIQLDQSDPQITKARITSDLVDLDQEFSATSEDELKQQITEWLYLDGSDAAAELLSALFRSSAAAITDGSPGSSTAQMTDTTFRLLGFYAGYGGTNNMRGAESGAHFGIWYDADSYTVSTPVGNLQGNRQSLTVPLWLHFNSRISLAGLLEVNYNNLEGTEFYGLSTDIGVAIRPVVRSGEDRFGWQIAPYLGGHGLASVDGVTAALLTQYGFVNRFEWRVFDSSLFSFITQYNTLDNLTVDLGDVSLSAPINQDILKNGFMYEFPFFSLRRLYGNVSFIDTRFLKDSAISNFQTYGFGLALRFKRFSLQTSLSYDDSDLYSATKWNMGTTWDL